MWEPINVCQDPPGDVLAHAQRLATCLRVLIWALRALELADFLDPDDFDGFTEIALQLEHLCIGSQSNCAEHEASGGYRLTFLLDIVEHEA